MYFQKFPQLYYDIKNDNNFRIATDILSRIAFKENVKNNASFYVTYDVKDHDLPETIAHKLYGSSEYHWIVLLMNEMINPYYDWPMSTRRKNSYVSKKYVGQALFMDSFLAGLTGFSGGETVTATGATGYVVSWDRTFSKLVVNNVSGSFAVSDIVTGATSGVVGTLGRVVAINAEAVHHFADATGDYLDPLSNPSGVFLGLTASGGATVIYTDTVIENYINSSVDTYTITNRTYEDDVNESKRAIKLIRPVYLQIVIDEFNKVFNDG